MLMMSTWSRTRPSLFGSSANSIACDQRRAAARARRRGAGLDGVQLGGRSYAQFAGDDVGDVCAVPTESRRIGSSDRIGICRQRWTVGAPRPCFTDEVVATDHLGAREKPVIRGGAGVVDHEIARSCRNRRNERWCGRERRPCRLISGLRTGTTERFVCVVDAAVDDGDTNALAASAEMHAPSRRRCKARSRRGPGGSRTRRPRARSRCHERAAADRRRRCATPPHWCDSCMEATTSAFGAVPRMRLITTACSANTCSRLRASPEPATDSPTRRTSTSTRPVAPWRLGCRTLRVARPASVSMVAGRANDSMRARLAADVSRGAAAANVLAVSKALHTAQRRP